jgi:hypothetical protein
VYDKVKIIFFGLKIPAILCLRVLTQQLQNPVVGLAHSTTSKSMPDAHSLAQEAQVRPNFVM